MKGVSSKPSGKHMFRSSQISSLLAMKLGNTKILCNLCLHFARQDRQDGEKPGRKITQPK